VYSYDRGGNLSVSTALHDSGLSPKKWDLSRLAWGRVVFLSVDPLASSYPMLTPYQFASNSPIAGIDLDGLEFYYAADGSYLGKYGESTEIRIVSDNNAASAKAAIGGSGSFDLMGNSARAFGSEVDAATSFVFSYNGETHRSGTEYSAQIFATIINNPETGYSTMFTLGTTVEGTEDRIGANVDPSKSLPIDPSLLLTANVHTHPADGGNDFSQSKFGSSRYAPDKGDKELFRSSRIGGNGIGVNMYLGTPDGRLLGMFQPSSTTIDLGIKVPNAPKFEWVDADPPSAKNGFHTIKSQKLMVPTRMPSYSTDGKVIDYPDPTKN